MHLYLSEENQVAKGYDCGLVVTDDIWISDKISKERQSCDLFFFYSK